MMKNTIFEHRKYNNEFTCMEDRRPEPGSYVVVQVNNKGDRWEETWFELVGVDKDGSLVKKAGERYDFKGGVPVAWRYIDIPEDRLSIIDVQLLTRNNRNIVPTDFLGNEILEHDSVVFCKNNKLYKGTVSHFTEQNIAVEFVDYDGALKCSYINGNKIMKMYGRKGI